ncbi:MAG: hypothetical protein QM779_11505 [Propionicimonas sp.]|uniref:hypothetical protein n=1 Tax=Propionicimonas sp. TaxID=1955623 RepID=UPI003D10456B
MALRLELAALSMAQMKTTAGHRAHLPGLSIAEYGSGIGWTDLVATNAVKSGEGQNYSAVRDKKARSVRTALQTLNEAGLVELRSAPGRAGRYEGFSLRHEAGTQLSGDPRPYQVPGPTEDEVFRLPEGFVERGWLHVLEDSEITVLLMVASARGSLWIGRSDMDLEPGEVAIPADARLRRYGIHRDPFSFARKTLEWFGLLTVREVARHPDGRAEDDERRLHRLALRPDGFEEEALAKVTGAIALQLKRG